MANVALTGGARLEGNQDTVDRTVYTTTAFAPSGANHLVTMGVFGWCSSTTDMSLPTIAGGGVTTWTEETGARQLFDGDRGQLTLYRALQPSWGGSAAATITWTNQMGGCVWFVCEWENVDTTGTNGSGALRQVVPAVSASTSSMGTTLAALDSAESMAVAFGGCMGATRTTTVGTGYTSFGNFTTQSGPLWAHRGEFKLNDTAPYYTIGGGDAAAAIVGFEIKAAAAVAGASQRFMWTP
jgi:hypothetical protein